MKLRKLILTYPSVTSDNPRYQCPELIFLLIRLQKVLNKARSIRMAKMAPTRVLMLFSKVERLSLLLWVKFIIIFV